jgi:cardiolipin synthase
MNFSRPAALAALLLGACSSLPTLVPDMSTRGPPVQLEGAHGPIGARQSKTVLANMASGGEETSIFERHLAHEEAMAGSPLVVGNRVTLLQDGPATYRAMFAAIEAARDHIHLETYILDDDEVGQRFARALIDKQAKGVQVALIYDSVGASATPKSFFKDLADAGVKVLEFNPVNPLTAKAGWDVNQRDHRKLLVVDGRTAFVGGINISSVYSAGSFKSSSKRRPDGAAPWRDTHVKVEGPVVADFQRLFLATWEKQKGEPLPPHVPFPPQASPGGEVVRAIGSTSDDPYSLIYATLLSAIGAAETRAHFTNAYFVPDPQLSAALIAAAARRVDVKLILPGQTDSWLVFHAGRAHYDELLRGGVRLYERRGALLHSKTVVIDGVWSTVGSTNLDWRSFLHNDEINAVILGQGFGAQMEAMFEADLAQSDEITLDRWERRPFGDRARELAARAWEYWL